MALTDAQKVDLSKLIGETPDATRSALDAAARVNSAELMAEIEAELVAILAVYSPVENKTAMKLSGGRDGISLDYSLSRSDLRVKARTLLGLSPYSTTDAAADPDALQLVSMRGGRWL